MGQKFKPFDLEAAKAGAPVMTRDGRPVRILAFDVEGAIYPVVAAVKTLDGKREAIQMYTESGEYSYVVAKHDYDLVMAPVKHRAWVNVHKIGSQYDLTSNLLQRNRPYSRGKTPTHTLLLCLLIGRNRHSGCVAQGAERCRVRKQGNIGGATPRIRA